jgi:hypothetical protein
MRLTSTAGTGALALGSLTNTHNRSDWPTGTCKRQAKPAVLNQVTLKQD